MCFADREKHDDQSGSPEGRVVDMTPILADLDGPGAVRVQADLRERRREVGVSAMVLAAAVGEVASAQVDRNGRQHDLTDSSSYQYRSRPRRGPAR